MKNLNKLCLVLSVGSIFALSISACSDDPATTNTTAGTSSGGSATAGTSSGGSATAGTGTAGTGTAGTGTAGTGTAGTGTAGTGTAGTATGGSGGSGGASGGSGGAGGKAGAGGTGGASGGSGGSGGAAGPMCADTDDPATTKAATCNDFCTDWDAKCKAIDAAKYADKAACMTDCATFSVAALCCRAYHVNNMPASDHCAHAKGMGPCAGK